jgi:phenylacetate-CoA ligase
MLLIDRLERIQEKQVLTVFRQAAKQIPFYGALLKRSRVDPNAVKSLRDFQNTVPVLDKEALFGPRRKNRHAIYAGKGLGDCQVIFPSSGYSGKFSFGMIDRGEFKRQQKFVDFALDYAFQTSKKKTLLINALSMGITIPALRVTIANTGLRSDVALSIIKTFAGEFDQIILVGETVFIKNLLEEGLKETIPWKRLKIHVVFGGESFPESFRKYLETLLGLSATMKKRTLVGSSFGFAEVGLNVLWETPLTILIRKIVHSDADFSVALLGESAPLVPLFFQHNPLRVFVEEEGGKLLFTNLTARPHLPLIRYATGDEGAIIPYGKLREALGHFRLNEYLPNLPLPVIAVKSRGRHLTVKGTKIYPDMVKDAFYSDMTIPGSITGFFRMKKAGGRLGVEVQLKKDETLTKKKRDSIRKALMRTVPVDVDVALYRYHEFPYAMEHDFERKFRYVG